jgi:hypothetical protein
MKEKDGNVEFCFSYSKGLMWNNFSSFEEDNKIS